MKNIYILFLLLPVFSFGQSQNLNYVKTTEYKIPTLVVIPNPDPEEAVISVSYFDGLGRPIQKVSHKQAANGKDIIQHIKYDDFGRVKLDYLPHVSQSQDMTFDANAQYNVINYYNTSYYQNTSNPYSEKLFDGSPLNRVLKQSAPGNPWAMNSGKEIKYQYDSNDIDDDVIKFQIQRNYNALSLVYDYTFQAVGKYQTGELYKNVLKNENWVSGKDNTSEEYTDKYGKVVLKRTYNQEVPHDTNYIYDNIGNLIYVVPPLASDDIVDIQENQAPYNFSQFINFSDFLIKCSGSQLTGGGGLYLSIQNSSFNCYFNAGFSSAKIDVTKTFPINAVHPIPDRDLISFYGYILRVENNVLKFVNNNVNGVEPCITALTQQLISPFPLEQSLFSEITTFTSNVNLDVLPSLCYQYRYDSGNRLVEKKLPGKAWEFIVYDKLDRPVYSGPALNPFTGVGIGWNVTKYDAFGRVVYTGWLSDAAVDTNRRKVLQGQKNAEAQLNETKTTNLNYIGTFQIKYTNAVQPNSNLELLTINYYDNYDFPDFNNMVTEVEGEQVQANVKGLSTSNWVRVLASSIKYEVSYFFYDAKSRLIRNHFRNHFGGYTTIDFKLNFLGQPIYTISNHQLNGDMPLYNINEYFEYTEQGRLRNHYHQINGGEMERLTTNEYDNLGQLISKDVGGNPSLEDGLQKVNYQYNIRGWLTHINEVNQLQNNPGQYDDLFAFKINYNTVEHTVNNAIKPLFNGNISETFWQTGSDLNVRKYGYKYDALNRLQNAIYQKPNDVVQIYNSYNENLWYDKNGNITNLERNGEVDDPNQKITIDKLTYIYETSSKNRLSIVDDSSNITHGFKDDDTHPDPLVIDSTIDYTYDDYGNMKTDTNKGVTIPIAYNHLNLPIKINLPNGIIEYLYNAVGVKVQKKVTIGTTIYTTDYQGGYQYLNAQLQFFPHAEGYLNVVSGDRFNYVYNYTDYLGNIRVSYGLDPESNVLKILEENHYYPFGMKHKNYGVDMRTYRENNLGQIRLPLVSEVSYKYKFQGQERQDELGLNWDSFKWRNYDYAIGRFMSIDPLTEQYNTWSPYAFSGNRVIDAREIEGLEPHTVHSNLNDAVKNFGTQYNGLSIRMKGEIGVTFYKIVSDEGVTTYSYNIPIGGPNQGMVSPAAGLLNDPLPKGATLVGIGHTHKEDNNDIMKDENGKIIYNGMNNFTDSQDYDVSDEYAKDNPDFEGSFLLTPNGKALVYVPSGKKDSERKKDVKRISNQMPSDPNSSTRENTISPNTIPEVLPYGTSQEDIDNLPKMDQ